MKRILLALFALALGSQALAATGDAVPLTSWKGRADSNGDVIIKFQQTNSTGTPVPTPVAGGTNVVLNGISGVAATSYFDKLTSSAAVLQAVTGSAGAASGGGIYVVSAGFGTITYTARTGVTPSAATTTSLTWTAGTASGNSWTFELVNCAGAAGIWWDVHDGANVPATFSNNLPLGRYFACGSTFINPIEVYAPNNPHFTCYANSLSATSASVSFKLYKRVSQ